MHAVGREHRSMSVQKARHVEGKHDSLNTWTCLCAGVSEDMWSCCVVEDTLMLTEGCFCSTGTDHMTSCWLHSWLTWILGLMPAAVQWHRNWNITFAFQAFKEEDRRHPQRAGETAKGEQRDTGSRRAEVTALGFIWKSENSEFREENIHPALISLWLKSSSVAEVTWETNEW